MPVEVDTVRAVSVPTRLVHGPGAVASLADECRALGITRPMLVTDPGVAAAGLVDRVRPQLNGVVVFDEVRPNPDIELVDRAAEVYRENGCDGLVGLDNCPDGLLGWLDGGGCRRLLHGPALLFFAQRDSNSCINLPRNQERPEQAQAFVENDRAVRGWLAAVLLRAECGLNRLFCCPAARAGRV